MNILTWNRSLVLTLLILTCSASVWGFEDRPNVVLIMTDDQGLGDFGCTGNSKIETPNIDKLYETSVRFSHFYVCPVCSPTRASLMTGRYNYRTRVVDTYIGRSMMDPQEVTLAERFRNAGYATGIFGKWHLGDCYPMRPHDQGFERAVVHRGGGIGQSSDPAGAEGAYTDPILFHNGQAVQETGYCTDVYYRRAMNFIQQQVDKSKPFFVYLPDNCPHGPFKDVPQTWWKHYRDQDLSNAQLPSVPGGYPVGKGKKGDQTNRIFSMISNVDENIGRLVTKLKTLGVYDNTIVIFMTDNGPNGERYTCGLRGRKTSVYEGGIRTLFLMHWPERIKSRSTRSEMAAHIDVTPTLIDACKLPPISDAPPMDGTSLMPLVDGQSINWSAKRPHFFVQTHRGNTPMKFHHFAAIGERYKLVHHSGFGKESFSGDPQFELFDLENDPYEKNNIIDREPEQFEMLKRAYEVWFQDVSNTRADNFVAPRIVIDPQKEKLVTLTRQDARRSPGTDRAHWPQTDRWRLESSNEHQAEITIRFRKPVSGTIQFNVNDVQSTFKIQNSKQFVGSIRLPKGEIDLLTYLTPSEPQPKRPKAKTPKAIAVHQVDLKF